MVFVRSIVRSSKCAFDKQCCPPCQFCKQTRRNLDTKSQKMKKKCLLGGASCTDVFVCVRLQVVWPPASHTCSNGSLGDRSIRKVEARASPTRFHVVPKVQMHPCAARRRRRGAGHQASDSTTSVASMLVLTMPKVVGARRRRFSHILPTASAALVRLFRPLVSQGWTFRRS